jgi:hypothetical protein
MVELEIKPGTSWSVVRNWPLDHGAGLAGQCKKMLIILCEKYCIIMGLIVTHFGDIAETQNCLIKQLYVVISICVAIVFP